MGPTPSISTPKASSPKSTPRKENVSDSGPPIQDSTQEKRQTKREGTTLPDPVQTAASRPRADSKHVPVHPALGTVAVRCGHPSNFPTSQQSVAPPWTRTYQRCSCCRCLEEQSPQPEAWSPEHPPGRPVLIPLGHLNLLNNQISGTSRKEGG